MGKNQTLSNNLRKLRFEHNEISQQELANAVGVTRLTIHSIETGKFNPSVNLALKIAGFFKKPVEEIFYLEEVQVTGESLKRYVHKRNRPGDNTL